MKIFFLLAFLCCRFIPGFTAEAISWQEDKGSHFIVYYTGSQKSFARETLYQAEKNYSRIAGYFGYSRHSNFWTWDNRVKIFIYPDAVSYMKATQMPSWSKGMADYSQKYIATYIESDTFLEAILPHEMAHLIFRDFVGFRGEVPLWLDEGAAQWAELEKRYYIQEAMQQYRKAHSILSLEDMMHLDIRQLKTGSRLVRLYYMQAASVVAFLIERFGIGRFAVFCRSLRDGSSLDEALQDAYPASISNVNQLEASWLDYLGQETLPK